MPTPTSPPPPTDAPTVTLAPPLARSVRVGLHGRNDAGFHELDYQLIRAAGVETLKMMSTTRPEVFARIQAENPGVEFIVRLYDDRINAQGHPTPAEFTERMGPMIQALQPYAVKFEVGNEPNHFRRYEGWGPDDADAESFKMWFMEVYALLKTAYPWAELGFPALGTPDSVHRDRAWLEINREAIHKEYVLSRPSVPLFHRDFEALVPIGVQRLQARLSAAPGDQLLQRLRVIAVQVS